MHFSFINCNFSQNYISYVVNIFSMANKSRFIIAESKIRAYFKDSPNYVFSLSQLSEILENNRLLWNLPASMNEAKFSEKLEASNIVIRKEN